MCVRACACVCVCGGEGEKESKRVIYCKEWAHAIMEAEKSHDAGSRGDAGGQGRELA